MRHPSTVVKLAVALALAAPCAASAQGREDAVAPRAGSPSGFVYEIPLEGGRRDAAPRDGRGGAGSGSTSTPRATIQTETGGFGSSSSVPGASNGDGSGGGTGTGSGAGGGAGSGRGNGGGGTGGASGAGGTGDGAGPGAATGTGGQPSTESARNSVLPDAANANRPLLSSLETTTVPFLVLALAILVGAGLGFAARRRRAG